MFKVGDYVDYKSEILEIAFIVRDMALLKEPQRDMFEKEKTKKYKKVWLKDCKPLPF